MSQYLRGQQKGFVVLVKSVIGVDAVVLVVGRVVMVDGPKSPADVVGVACMLRLRRYTATSGQRTDQKTKGERF